MHRALAIALTVAGIGCGLSNGSSGTAEGERIFKERFRGGNTFACATCHALTEPAADGIHRVGHPLAGSTRRGAWKNGAVTRFADAVNACVTDWLGAEPLAETEAEYQALASFLDSRQSVAGEAPVEIAVVAPPTNLSGGDAERGRSRFNQTCIACHGEDAVGTVRAPSLRILHNPASSVARKVRSSGPVDSVYVGLTGGRMPFYGANRLSDSEVIDIATYVDGLVPAEGTSLPDGGWMSDGGTPSRVIGTPGACASTHALVGQSRALSQRAHGVRGTVTITNDCTITFTDLYYDGGGIDVRVYGAKGDFSGPTAFAIGPQLFGNPMSSVTLHVTLPADKTLNDLDRVSIWCVAAKFSFGDAAF